MRPIRSQPISTASPPLASSSAERRRLLLERGSADHEPRAVARPAELHRVADPARPIRPPIVFERQARSRQEDTPDAAGSVALQPQGAGGALQRVAVALDLDIGDAGAGADPVAARSGRLNRDESIIFGFHPFELAAAVAPHVQQATVRSFDAQHAVGRVESHAPTAARRVLDLVPTLSRPMRIPRH